MSMDDNLERRLRDALTTPRASDQVDVDDFLASVHRGARVRQVRRRASIVLGAALLVAGGGLVVDVTGLLNGSKAPVASSSNDTNLPAKVMGTSPGTYGSGGGAPVGGVGPVKISPKGPIPASDVTPVSLTATGTDHQWVLATTPGHACGRPTCATVFSTDKHGKRGTWADLGQLPIAATTGDNPTPASVSALRFTLRTDGSGIYDGWAYGDAFWSTHDSGKTWSAAASPPGQVTQLESWGDFVYAAVIAPAGGSTSAPATGATAGPTTATGTGSGGAVLYRSPTTADDWQPVDVGQPLTDVTALAAAQGVVGLVDTTGVDSSLYISPNGTTWEPQQPCPTGTEPRSLSSAGDTTTGISSLWVTCSNVTTTVVLYMDTDHWGQWVQARGQFGGAVMIAARTPRNALAAGAGISGIQSLTATKDPVSVYGLPVGVPVFFGFTNSRYGYLLDSSGAILSTTDGGGTWLPYAVSSTP